MKIGDLVVGLFQMAGAACLLFLPTAAFAPEGYGRAAFGCLFFAGFLTNAIVGVNRVMDALFGEGGLILDYGRYLESRYARVYRGRPVGTRLRSTRPSARLRARGAKPRFRGRGCRRLGG